MANTRRLSESVADDIRTMITIEKRFRPGDKIPNENELSRELDVSRTTLREAVRILITNGVLEIRRGLGTYVREENDTFVGMALGNLTDTKAGARDLYEMRLIFEPEAAALAAARASDQELKRIIGYGRQVEGLIREGKDRTEAEHTFHKAIAKATHNDFMYKLMPVLYEAIGRGVALSAQSEAAVKSTLSDHGLIMEFLEARDAQGARSAMKIHIRHAMKELGLDPEG